MPLKYRCSCGRTLMVPSRLEAAELRCPKCGESFQLPHSEQLPSEPFHGAKQPPAPSPSSMNPVPINPPASSASRPTVRTEPEVAELIESAPQPLPRYGYQPDLGKRELSLAVAIALLLTAMLGCVPAIWELKDHFQAVTSPGVACWAYGVFFIALLQVAYAVYLVQLPDWSSMWTATGMLLLVAATYALSLGVTLARNPEATFVRMLDLTDHLSHGRAAIWCLVMLTVTALLAVGTGRLAAAWRRDVLGR